MSHDPVSCGSAGSKAAAGNARDRGGKLAAASAYTTGKGGHVATRSSVQPVPSIMETDGRKSMASLRNLSRHIREAFRGLPAYLEG
jgi:hypothetical protein